MDSKSFYFGMQASAYMLLLGSSSFRGILLVAMQIYFFASAECELKLFGFADCFSCGGGRESMSFLCIFHKLEFHSDESELDFH